MLQTEQVVTTARTRIPWNGVERRRVEKVVETLAALRSQAATVSEVAHDARNMVTALGLYCDLLEEPGVIAVPFTHYAHELRLVAAASRRLVEKLVTLDARTFPDGTVQALSQTNAGRATALTNSDAVSADAKVASGSPFENSGGSTMVSVTNLADRNRRWDLLAALPISNLAAELLANRNLLSALAGPSIALTMEAEGGAQAVRLTGEDLTRLLVNLVKNAAEAMPKGGRVHIGLRGREAAQGTAPCLALTIEDNGPGIPEAAFDKIFTSGYTSRGKNAESKGEAVPGCSWPQSRRGLGLAIVRAIVEGAGGRITASNRKQGGACFTLELPVRTAGIREGCGV
ncbi:MAG: ATP-binding protein [Terracidiphilus sp.]